MMDATTADVASTAPSLTITRTIGGSPEDVFDAWTRPEVFSRWFGPKRATLAECAIDLRVGGGWRAVINGVDGNTYTVTGEYVDIDRPNQLVFTWGWVNDGERGRETLVTVTLAPEGSYTKLTLLHERFESDDMRNRHNEGWAGTLDCLEELFA